MNKTVKTYDQTAKGSALSWPLDCQSHMAYFYVLPGSSYDCIIFNCHRVINRGKWGELKNYGGNY